MRKNRLFYAIVLGLIFLLGLGRAYASSENGKILSSFTMAILSDSSARTDAMSLVMHMDQIFSDQDEPYQLERAKDLVEYLIFLQSRIEFFRKNDQILSSFIHEAATNDVTYTEPLDHLLSQEHEAMAAQDLTRNYQFQFPENFRDFYGALKKIESTLLTRLKKMQVINDEVRALKMDLLAQRRRMASKNPAESKKERLQQMRSDIQKKEAVIANQEQAIAKLKNQFDQVQLGMQVFRERLQETDQHVDDLVKQVASRSLDLYDKEKQVVDANQKMTDVQGELQETKERLRLVQHIIQEKDDHIKALEKEVGDIHSQVTSDSSNDEAVASLRDEMNSTITQLRSNITESQARIAHLEKRFQDIALDNAQLKSDILKKNLMVSFLEKQLEQKDEMLADLEKGFYSKSQKIMEMKDIVKIYHLKLKEFKGRVEQQELQLQLYQERLGKLKLKDVDLRSVDSLGGSSDQVCSADRLGCLFWNDAMIRDQSIQELKKIRYLER